MKLRYLAVCVLIAGVSALADDDDGTKFRAKLTGLQEVPAILTSGTGTFTATLDPGGASISFTLTFSGLSSSAGASHIHFAQPGVSGAVFVFFCGGGGKPACPAGGGTITGTITGADVVGVPAQGITAGSFSDLLRILKAGDGYVNVHTA